MKKEQSSFNSSRGGLSLLAVSALLGLLLLPWSALAGLGDDLYQKAQDYDRYLAEHVLGSAPELDPNHDSSRDGYGFSLEIKYTDDTWTTVDTYRGMGDGTFLTGLSLAAQCFRYRVTGEPAAMELIERLVWALHHALRCTQTPGYIARFVGPYTPEFRHRYDLAEPNVNAGTGAYQGAYWLSHTSRDQYLGWFMGLWLAHPLVPATLQAVIAEDMREVIETLVANDYLIIDENGTPSPSTPNVLAGHKIAFHVMAASILCDQQSWFQAQRVLAQNSLGYQTDSATTWLSQYMGYYAFNLDHMTLYPLAVHLDPWETWSILQWWQPNVRQHVAWTQNAWFDLVYLAALRRQHARNHYLEQRLEEHIVSALVDFFDPPKSKDHPTSYTTPPQNDPVNAWIQNFMRDLNAWLQSLGVTGYSFPVPDDHATDPFPFPERCRGTFIWQRAPTKFNCGRTDLTYSYIGMDFSLAYWMARHYGVVPEPTRP
jgi:hypothetical protein